MELQNIEQFHFLRPLWLIAIPIALLLVAVFWQRKSSAFNWRTAINKELLSHLIEDKHSFQNRWPIAALFAAWIICAIALAGPSWEKLPQPVHKRQDALVVALDLSLSMYAKDVKPSRLVRAQHKVLDILKHRSEGLSGLIAYSRDAHIVSPLTDDNRTIGNLVPALAPDMMPAFGSNPTAAISEALSLFKNTGLNEGRILLISDSITKKDVGTITKLLKNTPFELSILAVATTEGAPIPMPQGFVKDQSGKIVTPKLNRQHFKNLASNTNGRYIEATLDSSDIEFLLPISTTELNGQTRLTERYFDQWRDNGAYLCLILLPLSLLAFRRGWLLILPLFLLFEAPNSYALEWNDLWQTKNQQGMELLEKGDAKQAAETFENEQWQAAANYRAGEYKAAAKAYQEQSKTSSEHTIDNNRSATIHYNQGNALAKAGKFEDALASYEKALNIDNNFSDASHNHKVVEDALKQQQNQPSQDQQQNQDQDQKNNEQNPDKQQNDQSDKSNNDNKESNQDNDQNPQNNDNQENKDDSDSKDKKESHPEQDKPSDDNKPPEDPPSDIDDKQANNKPKQEPISPEQKEAQQRALKQQAQDEADKQEQATEQWLRQIPDDPSGLLRRKFDYEYRLKQADKNTQDEDQPLW